MTVAHELGHALLGQSDEYANPAVPDQAMTTAKRHSWSGKLTADDRDAFLRAIESTRLLDVPSSTRNIGDDEEPIIVTVREGKLVHEVRIWHDDAVAAGLALFEAHVLALAKRVSAGEVLTIPAR